MNAKPFKKQQKRKKTTTKKQTKKNRTLTLKGMNVLQGKQIYSLRVNRFFRRKAKHVDSDTALENVWISLKCKKEENFKEQPSIVPKEIVL